MKKIFNFIFLLFTIFTLNAQNTLSLTQNGKTTKLVCKPKATYENINGSINLSITTEDNMLLELNNIDENIFKCGKNIFSKIPKIVLINHSEASPYVSVSSVKIFVKCEKGSKKVAVNFSGLIKNNTSKIYVLSKLIIEQTPRKNLTTDK